MYSKYFLRCICLLLAVLCLAGEVTPALAKDDIRATIEAKKDNSRIINVPLRGETQFYSQKNPLYASMVYEYRKSPTSRIFGDGGCAPTSGAMAIMALLDAESLPALQKYTKEGTPFSLCPHSINSYGCRRCKERMPITAAADYKKYLPLVLGAYACGDNKEGTVWRRASATAGGSGGTGAQFLESLCPHLGLTCEMLKSPKKGDWLDQIDEDTVGIMLSISSPFTGGSHYVTVISADKDYFYILDPMEPESYKKKNDPNRVLEVIEPGLVRVKRSNYKRMGVYTAYLISKPAEK
ncbi:MAG: hypothetical protein IKW00_02175 [Clostridia bacterium]|nr:hypothetical protein [Clostridia bacterium]